MNFYFQKQPSQLTFKECLYLARIIPSPKKFMYQFNAEGILKESAAQQERFVTNIMLKRGLLASDDTLYKSLPLYISGPARSYLRIKVQDSIPKDSLNSVNEFNF